MSSRGIHAVLTFEQANSLINRAIEECSTGDLGAVVLDELHMLDDEHRGYLMELTVTKLLLLKQNVQIIGMSATLSVCFHAFISRYSDHPSSNTKEKNTELLAAWMNAQYFISTYRPVPIDDYLVYENSIYPAATARQLLQVASNLTSVSPADTVTPHRTIDHSEQRQLANPTMNAMVSLAVDTALAGYGALVFCGSRQGCQASAIIISEAMSTIYAGDEGLFNKRQDLLADLRSLPCGLDPALETVIARGVGIHRSYLCQPPLPREVS